MIYKFDFSEYTQNHIHNQDVDIFRAGGWFLSHLPVSLSSKLTGM